MALPPAIAVLLLLPAALVSAHPGIGIVRDANGVIYYTDLTNVWQRLPDGTASIVVPGVHTHELYLAQDGTLHGEHLWYTGEATDTWMHYTWRRSPDGRLVKDPERKGGRSTYSFIRDAEGAQYDVEHGTPTRFFKRTADGQRSLIGTTDLAHVGWPFCARDGALWFASGNDLYHIVDGEARLVASDLDGVTTPGEDQAHAVMGLWDDREGRIHAAVSVRREVVRIGADGTRSVLWRSEAPWSPSGGLVDDNGELWLLEYDPENNVRLTRVPAARMGGVQGAFPWSGVGVTLAGAIFISLLVGLGSRKKAGSALQAAMAR